MASYPVRLVKDDSGLRVVCRDLPEVLTWGDDRASALEAAADAIEVVIASAMDAGREVPLPSAPEAGEELAPLPALLAAKLGVWRAWRASGLSKVELARLMGVAETEVRRILDPEHATKLATLEAAARALGHRITVEVAQAA